MNTTSNHVSLLVYSIPLWIDRCLQLKACCLEKPKKCLKFPRYISEPDERNSGCKLSQLISGKGTGADTAVDVATSEFRFGAVVLTQNWCSIKPKKRLA